MREIRNYEQNQQMQKEMYDNPINYIQTPRTSAGNKQNDDEEHETSKGRTEQDERDDMFNYAKVVTRNMRQPRPELSRSLNKDVTEALKKKHIEDKNEKEEQEKIHENVKRKEHEEPINEKERDRRVREML